MNRIYKIIYSEARNGYMVVSELACRHGRSTRSGRAKAAMAAAVLTALVSFSWTGMTAEAAVQSEPLVVTKTGQTVTDDFDVKDCGKQAVLEIGSTAAADTKGVTTVNSKTISGTYSNKGEANGIWVQNKYPGKVNLADGMIVKVDATGNHYNATGIYLEGVDRSHDPKSTDESVNANEEYKNNGNQISSTTVNVGSETTITVNAKAPEGKTGVRLDAHALENHFGHMIVGDNVNLSVKSGAFSYNQTSGFYSLFYGDTVIGNHFTSTAEAVADKDTGETLIRALESLHDHFHLNGQQIETLAQNKLTIGSDAHLTSTLSVQSSDNQQQINNEGMLLSRTDFSIGDRLTVDTTQKGEDKDPEKESSYGKGHAFGIFVQDTQHGTIGVGLKNTVTVNKRNDAFVSGIYLSGWEQKYIPSEDDKKKDTTDISIKEDSHNDVTVTDSAVEVIRGIDMDSNSKLNLGKNGEMTVEQISGKADEVDGIDIRSGSTIQMGDNSRNHIVINSGNVKNIHGINAQSQSKVTLGDGNQQTISINGGTVTDVYGINPYSSSEVDVGERGTASIRINDGTVRNVYGISPHSSSEVNVGERGNVSITQTGGTVSQLSGFFIFDDSKVHIQKNGTISISQKDGKSSSNIYGLEAYNNSTVSAEDGLQIHIDSENDKSTGDVYGLYNYFNSHMTLGNNSNISAVVKNTSQQPSKAVVSGMRNILAESKFGNDLHVQVQADNYGTAEGIRNTGVDLNSGNKKNGSPATMIIGDNLSVDVKASELSSGGAPTVEGIRNGTNHLLGYTFTDGKNTLLTVGKNAQITVTAPDQVTDVSALHSFNHADAEIGDGAVLTVNSHAQNSKVSIINNVVKTDDAGKVTFDGGMILSGSQNAIYSTGNGSSVTAVDEGRKVILGDLESADKGSIKLKLNTGDSLFRGKSIIDPSAKTTAAVNGLRIAAALPEADDSSNAATAAMADTTSADTELTLESGARWDMTDTSQVTKLVHENGGLVNMAYNPSYQRLDVNVYSGKNGIFRMKTDLASQTDGDKVYMTSAEAGSQGLVQVHDESFLKGKEVTGTKHLLLITDYSKNATFSGLTLDDGGLWDVTPTIQNGQYVHDVMGVADANEKQWYLTKLEKKVNKDTIPLMKAADNSYALYRLDIDSLRKRMGDLRFRNVKDDSGIWARDFHGAYEGQGTDSRYNGFQLGYDYAANEKSLYGFFAERTISNPKYSYGSSKDHGLSGGLYGTWFGDSGVYTDVVAKWGRNDTELHTRGGWPDSANYRTRSESLSVEWGKTFTRDDGLFLEPEAQMVFGRLGSKDYTTSRGRTVHMGSYDSAIGRLGLLLGKRVTEGDHPYDYYLKFSLLHEFGGERNFHLAAPDGETMDYSEDYRDTWQEAGRGGTWHINGNTSIYADAERSFGGSWHKKWQWNLGINWQF